MVDSSCPIDDVCYLAYIANVTSKADLPTVLRSLCAKLALMQEQFADRLGVSFATVNGWEGGQSKPQRAQAEAISALLGESGIDEDAGACSDSETAPIVPRRARRAASATPTIKPMGQMLWDAACSIRAPKEPVHDQG